MLASTKPRHSFENKEYFGYSIKNQKKRNVPSYNTSTTEELISSSVSNIKIQSHLSSKKSNNTQHILQSVYKRCNLDGGKKLGYACVCDVSHSKNEKHSKTIEQNNLSNAPRDLTLEENTITSCPNEKILLTYEHANTSIAHECYNLHESNRDLGKKSILKIKPSPRTIEELNIITSLEMLDWKLNAIGSKLMRNKGGFQTSSRGQFSSKSSQSTHAFTIHDGPSKSTSGKTSPSVQKTSPGVQKTSNNCSMPSQPLPIRTIPRKLSMSQERRQLVGVTNKNQAISMHELHPKSEVCISPPHIFSNEKNKGKSLNQGFIVWCKDPHGL